MLCYGFLIPEDGEGIWLSLCDGKTQSGFQRNYHQSCNVSTYAHAFVSYHCEG